MLAADFTNELTDFSVGDAWAPEYEEQGGGWSVVLARTPQGQQLLTEMKEKNIVRLDKINNKDVVDMHSHMIDFKKRGSFIRMQWRKEKGLPVPNFGYHPVDIPASRYRAERIISFFFWVGKQPWARWIVEHLPLHVIGPVFNWLRLTWKKVSKKEKRAGLHQTRFET